MRTIGLLITQSCKRACEEATRSRQLSTQEADEMKNQYVGDINDFCKYGLLRALTERGKRAVTVVWMLTPDDASADGGKRSYLSQPDRWRWRDPELFDALEAMMAKGQKRSVTAIEASGVVGDAQFEKEHVPRERTLRTAYFGRVLNAALGSGLVFFDPDNGLEIASCPPGRRGSEKYLLWSELTGTYAAGHSVLLYQHFPRRSREAFVAEMADRIAQQTGARLVQAFKTPGVVFLLAAQKGAEAYFGGRLPAIADAWSGVIELCDRVSRVEAS